MEQMSISITRISLLIRRFLVINAKSILITVSTLVGVLFSISLLNTYFNDKTISVQNFNSNAAMLFFITGFVFTANIFKEIKSFSRGWFYFMLPANPVEKLISAWLISSVGYTVVALALLSLTSLLLSLAVTILFSPTLFVFNPLDPGFSIQQYLIFHSVFFLGAISFRSYNFFKTILSVLGVGATIFIITLLVIRLIFPSWNDWSITFESLSDNQLPIETLSRVVRLIYYWVFAPFLLIVSYFKLKEKEI